MARSRNGSTEEAKGDGHLVEEEESENGSVGSAAYKYFLTSMGGMAAVVPVVCILIYEGAQIMSLFWLGDWTADPSAGVTVFLVGYTIINLVAVLAGTAQGAAVAHACVKASETIHNELLSIILRRPTSFFDTTPIGRVITRFSKDLNELDLAVGRVLAMTLSAAVLLVRVLVTMAIATKGLVLIALLPVLFLYRKMASYSRGAAVLLARLSAVTKAPVLGNLTETVHGLTTIRAFNKTERMLAINRELVDTNTRPILLTKESLLWMAVRLEAMASSISFSVAMLVVFSHKYGWGLIPTAWVAIALTAAQQLTAALQSLVIISTYMESSMANVERIHKYVQDKNTEAPLEIEDTYPGDASQWPSQGAVEFDHVKMRYRDGPLVLKGISATIKPKEKVGVVGRTGAGKSSLVSSIFRLQELAGGSIKIDGVDISKLGLATLRSRIAIVPQEPTLFTGTLRYNLDPFDEFDDATVWDVLEQGQLAEFVRSLDGGLKATVAEGGTNLSVGQRQLLCLSRALLRKPKVCVLDEATASVDPATDNAIQAMVRTAFAESTVITIAHRLETVLDSDRIITLDAGRVAEFDSPARLLQRSSSLLSQLVEAAGPETAARLRAIARH